MSYSPTTNILAHTDILAQAVASILPMGGSDAYWDDILMMIEEDEKKVANVVREGEESISDKKVWEGEESTSAKKVTEDEECTSASLDILRAVSENEEMYGVEYIETIEEEDVKVLMMKIGKFLK